LNFDLKFLGLIGYFLQQFFRILDHFWRAVEGVTWRRVVTGAQMPEVSKVDPTACATSQRSAQPEVTECDFCQFPGWCRRDHQISLQLVGSIPANVAIVRRWPM
jgi:hypothetical protein